MIHELDTVALTVDLPEFGLKQGDLGAVVMAHPDVRGYEVEFVSLDGGTIALASLAPAQIRPVRSGEIAHARAVSSEYDA